MTFFALFVSVAVLAAAHTHHECQHNTVMKHTKIAQVDVDYGESNVEKRDLKEVDALPLRVYFDVDDISESSPNQCSPNGPATVTIFGQTYDCSKSIYHVSQVCWGSCASTLILRKIFVLARYRT